MEAQTPFAGGATVAAGLSHHFPLTFPRSGHGTGFTSGPAMQAILRFLAGLTRRPFYSLSSLRRNNFYLTRIPGTNERSRVELNEDPFIPLP